MTLLVHEHSHCAVLQPDDQAFIRSEIASQLENITSPQLSEIIRTLADVSKVFADCLD